MLRCAALRCAVRRRQANCSQDLGLGVLEEKDANATSDTDGESDTQDSNTEKDVLGKLMGRQQKQDPAGIEVLQNTTS